ncbi:unnamed protein product [Psylliodes chrysocephalus]|uniref:RecA family profile 1 domain-containing protein n=1 Tax=Psylliodes chrysocephalus TaxID=3402493 RepID=A0A9P0G6G2_9CUCU|nr:unnamed protein product [Psylliodes chrysocephala]
MEYLSSSVHLCLNSSIVERLNGAQIFTVSDFLNSENKQIEKITALTAKEILELRKNLLKKFVNARNAYNYYKSISNEFAIVPTGISRLDNLLEGGLFTGNIYEICGLPASGKTYFCLTLLNNLALKHITEIMYIDTKNDFSALKLKQMMMYHLEKDDMIAAMNRIIVNKVNSKQHFLSVLLEIKHALQNGQIIKFVIIDSLPPLIWNSVNHTENNSFLTYSANILHYLAKEYNAIIIVTNLITLWNEGDFKNRNIMKEKISCGSFWYTVPNVRIVLKKDKNLCKMTLTKSIRFVPPINSCDVTFNNNGLI